MMSNRLNVILDDFERQDGVSEGQAKALRATLANDPALRRQFEHQAEQRNLQAFSLASNKGGPANRVGRYDSSSGTLVLPREAFRSDGTAAANLAGDLRVQETLIRFAHGIDSAPTSREGQARTVMTNHLQEVINASPALADQIRRAVTPLETAGGPPLKGFDLLDPGQGMGGAYFPDTRLLKLPRETLGAPGNAWTSASAEELTWTCGHEVQHSLNTSTVEASRRDFVKAVRLTGLDTQHAIKDYSAPLQSAIATNRWDESSAQIAGYNAAHTRRRAANPSEPISETQKHLAEGDGFRAGFFLDDKGAPRPGFAFNADGTLTNTTSNNQQEGIYYFDNKNSGLGAQRNVDYPNYYGADAIGQIIQRHRISSDGPLKLDMAGLDRSQVEVAGLDIGSPKAQPYIDSSQPLVNGAPQLHYFHQTINEPAATRTAKPDLPTDDMGRILTPPGAEKQKTSLVSGRNQGDGPIIQDAHPSILRAPISHDPHETYWTDQIAAYRAGLSALAPAAGLNASNPVVNGSTGASSVAADAKVSARATMRLSQ